MDHPPKGIRLDPSRLGFPYWILILAWILFVFYEYFSATGRALPFLGTVFDTGGYPPVDDSTRIQVWKESFWIVLVTFLISGVTWASGRWIRRLLIPPVQNPWIGFGIDFGLGMVFLDLFWMGTGLAALWYKPLWTGMAIFLVSLFLFELAVVLRAAFRNGVQKPPAITFHYWPLLLIGLFYWAYSFLQGLAPETFYDSMVYHLAVPRYWVFHHGLADFPTNFFSNYPFSGELYFLNGLVFQGTESAKMLHVVAFGVCAVFLSGWAREMAGAQAGWLALGLTLTLPLLTVNIWTTQVEGLLALVILLFVYAINRFILGQGNPAGWALMAGLFTGFALSIKYTAVLFLVSTLAVLLFQKTGAFRKASWRYWTLLTAGCLLLAGPWLLKNFAYTGNPFFPYLMSLFPGRHLTQASYDRLLMEQHARATTGFASWFLLPWKLTMSNPDSYNFCGPVWLAFLPALFLFRLRHPVLRFLAWMTPLVMAGGFAMTHIFRFIAPDFILFYLLMAVVLAGGEKPVWGRVAAWGGAAAAVLCFANLAAISHYYYSCAGIWSGRQTRAQYLSQEAGRITPYYPMAQWVSKNLPSQATLLIVGDARGLYYDRPFLTASVFDEQTLALLSRQEKDPEGIYRRLKEMGVDDLVVNGSEGVRVADTYHHYDLTSGEWDKLDDFLQRGTELVYQHNLQAVYRIRPALFAQRPAQEIPDLVEFFSGPSIRYLSDIRKDDAAAAGKDLEEILRLYPHSDFWKRQESGLKGS